jgi:hypothetical protein
LVRKLDRWGAAQSPYFGGLIHAAVAAAEARVRGPFEAARMSDDGHQQNPSPGATHTSEGFDGFALLVGTTKA